MLDSAILEQQRHNVLNAKHELPFYRVSEQFEGLKVLGLVADTSACGHYRVILPLHLLKMMGAEVNYSSHHDLKSFLDADLIIAPRQHSPEVYEILRMIAWEGKTIIYELDDNLNFVLPSSPAYKTYHNGSKELNMLPKMIGACHGFVTTTPEIAKWYYQHNRNVAVVENYIDFSLRDWNCDVSWVGGHAHITPLPIEKPIEFGDKIVIGYTGGSTHQDDIEIIGPVIKRVLEKHKNVAFALYTSIEMAAEFIHKFNLPIDRVHHIPARHFLDYPKGLAGIDIALCPIVPCEFNIGKSWLKNLETMTYGAACISSNIGPYTKFAKRHPGYTLLVGQGKTCYPSWEAAIDYLVLNPSVLQELKIKGRQLIIDNYSMENNVYLWPAAWRAILERANQGFIGKDPVARPKAHYQSFGVTGRNDLCPCNSGLKYKVCCNGAF